MKNAKSIFSLVISSILFFTGCSSAYKQPENGGATVTFKMAEDLTSNANQFYSIYPGESCEKQEGYGEAANMMKLFGMGGLDKDVIVPQDTPIFILAEINTHTGGSTVYSRSCRNFVKFIPKSGGHYSVQQVKNCKGVRVLSKSSNKEPESVEVLKIPVNCKFNKR